MKTELTVASLESNAPRARALRSLRTTIKSGQIQVGSVLPSERSLRETLKVSRGTLRRVLSMLEEEGLAASTLENNKKVYSVTTEGTAYLEENKRRVEALFERLEEAGKGFERGRSPEIMKAFHNLRGAVVSRVSRESVTAEQIRKISEAINAAAKAIDEL